MFGLPRWHFGSGAAAESAIVKGLVVGVAELTVVIGVIGVLIAVLKPASRYSGETATALKTYVQVYSLPIWMLCGVAVRIVMELRRQHGASTRALPASSSASDWYSWIIEWLGDQVREQLADILFPYLFGAVFSDSSLLWAPCILATLAIWIMCLKASNSLVANARICLHCIFWPSILCLWVEPWTTAEGIIFNVLTGTIGLGFDLVITAVWALSIVAWSDVISREWKGR